MLVDNDEETKTRIKEKFPTFLCFLLTLLYTGYCFQYYLFALFLTRLTGNKFANSAIFGGAELISVLGSGWLMKKLPDMTVFHIISGVCMLSYMVLIFFPDASVALIYLSNCAFVGSMGGWQNIFFLIAELRVPPAHLGANNMISQTAGVGYGIIVPYIAVLPD